MNSEAILRFVSHNIDYRNKPLVIGHEIWREAVNMVYSRGCRLNVASGLSKSSVPTFLKQLRLGLEQNSEASSRLAGLVSFLDGPGKFGFALSRGFRRAW